MALQSIAGDPLYCHMHTLIFWWIILYSTADVASSLLMFDAEGLVPCLLQQVLPLIVNHADAETILGDPKVCAKKYYCYSYFKSPFTDKNNLTKDLWPEQRCYSPFKGENSTAGELIPGRCNYQGTFFTASVENLPVTMISYIPLDKKKKIRSRENWQELPHQLLPLSAMIVIWPWLVLPYQSLSFYPRTPIGILLISVITDLLFSLSSGKRQWTFT